MAGKSIKELAAIAPADINEAADLTLIWDDSDTTDHTKKLTIADLRALLGLTQTTAQTVTGTNTNAVYLSIAQQGVLDIASVVVPSDGVWAVTILDVVSVRYPLGGAIDSPPTMQSYCDTANHGRIYSNLSVDHAAGYRTTVAGEERTIVHFRGTIFTGRFSANEVIPLRLFGNLVPIAADVLCGSNITITRVPDLAAAI